MEKVIDASGNEVCEVEDIEVDWNAKTIKGLILGGKDEMVEKLFGRLGARSVPDISVPVDAIAVMGSVVVLSKNSSDHASITFSSEAGSFQSPSLFSQFKWR